MSDLEKLIEMLPNKELFTDNLKEAIINGNIDLVLYWDKNGNLESWGTL